MTKPIIKQPSFSGIGPGQTAILSLPMGQTYDLFLIDAMVDISGTSTAVPPASWGTYFGEIRVVVDGTTIQQADADTWVKINSFHHKTFEAGSLPLFQARPWMALPGNEDVTSLGTGGINTLTIEVDIKDGVTVNSLTCYAETSAQKPFGTHRRVTKHQHVQGVIGQAEITDLPKGPYSLQAMHFNTTAIDNLTIKLNNRDVIETSKRTRAVKAKIDDKTPQAGMTHINVLTRNRFSEAMPMAVADFRVIPNFTATGNFVITSEILRDTL